MVTKRKRTTRKAPAKKLPAPPQNEEACSNFVAQNQKPASLHEAANEVEVNQYNPARSSSSSSTDSDSSLKVGESSSDDSAINRRSKRSAKSRAWSNKLSNVREIENPLSSSILHASGRRQNQFNKPQDVSHYSSEELRAASAVIEKVMRLEAAQPFNVPVDPIALGRPDYFDVVQTPMDFSTISHTLRNNVKYLNPRDVFNDVEYIWNNCLKLYSKDEYIVYLMKRVKKKFIKYWTAAGLDSGISRKSKGHSDFIAGYNTRNNSQFQSLYSFGHAVEGDTQLPTRNRSGPRHFQQTIPSLSRLQFFPPLNNSMPYQLQHLPPSTHQNQFSRLQTGADCSNEGFCRSAPMDPVDPMVVEASQLLCQTSRVNRGHIKEPWQRQADSVQPQSSRMQANLEIENSHIALTESTMRGIDCALRYSLGPSAEKPSEVNPDELCVGVTRNERTLQNEYQSGQSQRPTENTVTWENLIKKGKNVSSKKKKGKKVRGPTRFVLSDDEGGEKIHVPLNDLGQPVGVEASKLSNFCGIIARDGHLAPLNHVHWRSMSETLKEEMWQLIQTKFDIDSSCKTWVLQSIGNKWRNWKAYLKANHFDPHETDEERVKDCDERILPEQWSYLVSYWNSDRAKKYSITNRAVSKMQRKPHAAGGKSFARIREEERQKRPDGKEPTRAELYIIAHTRKDGQPVDETAAATIAKLREQASKKQRTVECTNGDTDTFCEVMGELRSNRQRTYGLGRESSEFGKRTSRREILQIVNETKKSANEQASRLSDKIEALEQKYEYIETQIGIMNSNMQKLLETICGQSR